MICDQDKSTSVYQFQVEYMTHTMPKNIGHIENIFSIFFIRISSQNNESYQITVEEQICINYLICDVSS